MQRSFIKNQQRYVPQFIVWLFVVVCVSGTYGQMQLPPSPEHGFQPAGSYALSNIETINTANGNMMLRIPIAALPPGRGNSPGFQLGLVYNSKLYDTHGLTAFQAQYWNGSSWVTVPNGSVTGNNLVWKQITFSPVTTTKIRLWITGTSDGYSRLTEIEAWGTPSGSGGGSGAGASTINWLVADHLGTPRIILDQSGGLANVKRHDYAPFGEELITLGGRASNPAYSGGDAVRQQFTQKERDVETALDYFLARYYLSTQGRFTSPDEFTGGPDELFTFADDASNNPTFYADLKNPQSLNKYQYAYNNPLRFVDPDGHEPEPDREPQDPCGCTLSKKHAGELQRDLEKLDEATSKPLYPITDTIGTSTPPTIGPITLPKDETVAPVPTIQPNPWAPAQPAPPPPPVEARRHRKGRRESTRPKHQKPRPGRPDTKDRQNPNWRPRERPKDWPKGKPWPPWKNPKPKDWPRDKPWPPPEGIK